LIAKLEEYIRKEAIKVYSQRFVNELENFVYHNGKPQARKGKNDDLIMCSALACWVRDTALMVNSRDIEYKKQFINSIRTDRKTFDSRLTETLPNLTHRGADGKLYNHSWILRG